jgi:hypothetical protein
VSRSFRVSDALAMGVTPSRLRAQDLVSPARGVRSPAPELHTVPTTNHGAERESVEVIAARARREFISSVQAFAPALGPGQFISHDTALALVGCPLPRYPYLPSLHVSAHRPAGKPRRKEVVGHRLQARPPAAGRSRGVPCEQPARAWRQTATLWDLDDLVAAGDFLISPRRRLLSISELRNEVEAMGDVPGGTLEAALQLLRVGAESPEETRLRLVLHRAGLPEPDLQLEIFTPSGLLVARMDLAFPNHLVAVEYDGRVHAEDAGQFQKDADRWDAIRAAGWQHVRILNHHLRPDPAVAVRKVTEALITAGWRPGDR